MEIKQEILADLRLKVELHAGRRMAAPADFDFLADAMCAKLQRRISSSTLKRVWGYIRDAGPDYSPGRYTLCTLAIFIGFRDIEDFAASHDSSAAVESDHYFGLTTGSADLPPHAILEVTWLPDRKIIMEHRGGSEFLIVSAENSKILTGDIIECHSFTQNAPLYISRVTRPDTIPFTYVAGVRTGVHYRLLPNPC